MRRRGFLLAILIYLALDLALPVMPSAFVLESEDSVDRLEIDRTAVLPALTKVPCARSPLPIDACDQLAPPVALSDRLTPTNEFGVGRRVLARLPRAALDSAPSSEDSH